MKTTPGSSCFLACALIAFACDSSTDGAVDAGSGGNGGRGGGDGQQNGGMLNAGGRGTDNLPPPATMPCGDALCRDTLIGDIHLEPCCVDAARSACGSEISGLDYLPIEVGCTELRQRGNVDASCPSVTFDDPSAPMDLPGCCMPSGECGVVADLLFLGNFGCVDPREFFTEEVNVPASRACVPLVEPDAGAGEPDASAPDGDPDASVGEDPADAG